MKKIILGIAVLLTVVVGLYSFKPMQSRPMNGEKAPNLIFKNPEGKVVALSELKGKIVMIDFWASWCGPCRRSNPFVVEMYNKYHNKKFNGGNGFEIYSVSLDKDANAWKAAIANDGLVWPYHVSDLKGWGSEAGRMYGIESIPQCYLIDGEGTIIGAGLRPENVAEELNRRLK
jgi:thiol-disulfide isomerase/thioredoxin